MTTGRGHPFYPELESLRGIAAFSVVILHIIIFMMFLPPEAPAPDILDRVGAPSFWGGMLGITIFNGRAAVPLFFVLSGFVMGLGLDTSRRLDVRTYGVFLVRRFFRLVLPLWASIFFGVAVQAYLGNVYSPAAILKFMTLSDISINSAEWSLVLEIAACLIYPLLLFSVGRLPPWAQFLAVGCAALVQGLHLVRVRYGDTDNDLPLYCFCLGIVVPTLGRAIVNGVGPVLRPAFAMLAVAGLMSTAPIRAYAEFYPTVLNQKLAFAAVTFGVPSVAFYLIAWIVYAQHPFAKWILNSRIATFLGTTSYSVYILHGQVMAFAWSTVTGLETPLARLLMGLATVVPMTLILSFLAYRYVERPSIALGKRCAAWVGQAFRGASEYRAG